jgi:hypothetical protein
MIHNLFQVRVKLKVQGLESIIDQRIQGSCPPHIYEGVTELALQCASFNKNDRPQMKVKAARKKEYGHCYFSDWLVPLIEG